MYFNKIPPAFNFRHAGLAPGSTPHDVSVSLEDLGGGVFRLRASGRGWRRASQARLDRQRGGGPSVGGSVEWTDSGGLEVRAGGTVLLASLPERAFGVLGSKWALGFAHDPVMRFYGLGEKNGPLEKTGVSTKFWNTDAFADFGIERVQSGDTDPLYASIPYVLIVRPEGCVGVLIDNPHPVFMNLAAREGIAHLLPAHEVEPPSLMIGAYDGEPDIYFIVGADAREVTRSLLALTGRPPPPPLWALGYHQCRFGYRHLDDLEELDRRMDEHGIPCTGLWLDIDYMDAFGVFTLRRDGFEGMQERMARLAAKGRRIVAILDPGVKHRAGNAVFESGLEADVFCRTPEGDVYSGFVWPGRTAMPDFTLARTREWWARHVEAFTRGTGFDGYWIDMNDPSTGSADLDDMRFNGGSEPHEAHHNQYALGMQEATAEGLRRARPGERPFVISRSGFISTQRHSALWTGDNWSNYRHLRDSIPMSLNLSLSGVAFNGPDVPGFGGDVTDALAVDWHKAGFLFPFFRNHCAIGQREQEPWRFPEPHRSVIIHYLRLRQKFLPHLHNLMRQHCRTGDPLLRPVFFDFPGEGGRFDRCSDQFLVGPSLLQAPFLDEKADSREVLLPRVPWFDAGSGRWVDAPTIRVHRSCSETPLYVRDGAVIPLLPGLPMTPVVDLHEIEAHVFLAPGSCACGELDYVADDGLSSSGEVSRLRLRAALQGEELRIELAQEGRPVRVRIVAHCEAVRMTRLAAGVARELETVRHPVQLTGGAFDARASVESIV